MSLNVFEVNFWEGLSFINFAILLSAANILMFLSTGVIVFLLRKYFIQFDLNSDETKMSRRDYFLSTLVLVVNINVGLLGWSLMNQGIISLDSKPLSLIGFDALLLFLLIDWGMYFAHFLTHKTFLYKLTHAIHHEHESMGTLSLYVMHPVEAFGFGVILLSLLSVYSIDITALLIFLFLNWILGVFAHSGIEPSKGRLANYICMTRFHQIHHENPNFNFGFYTPFLDMLFKTRYYKLKKEL